ncbi:MAG: SpoIID/LytB domain-containing protein [Candidatus Sumerlaeaceae bacterium]|jgi:SpoIID/LytB domain protein
MEKLSYSEWWGPRVRIGILQHQQQIRVSLRGRYRIVTASGARGDERLLEAADFRFTVVEARPAVLGYRLVLAKSPKREVADAVSSPHPVLDPLETLRLGYEFAAGISSVEYWRCSRRYGTEEEATTLQARLPKRERVSLMTECVEAPRGMVRVHAGDLVLRAGQWVRFEPCDPDNDRAVIHDVIVGVSFHWKHYERQRFRGVVEIRVDNKGLLTAINELPAEAYLFSVNSSEMMSVMPEELLKAQTVAARNTLFATMGKHHYADPFHLCADDHCQCYRGSSRETADSRRVTLATLGEVLVHNGEVCDCRYSKMCGGIIESFDSVWNEEPRGYLVAKPDAPAGSEVEQYFPANTEEHAAALIAAKPDVWCNTTGDDVPPYLRYSAPYFRWEIRLDRRELEERLSQYLGVDIGRLEALEPISRGASGRVEYLRVVGTRGSWVLGTVAKQYSIREALSPSFLYSSAFVVNYERNADGTIATVILKGAGWGHGAGMCQVGATMMAYRGKNYREILEHYYPNSSLMALASSVPSKEEVRGIVEREESRVGERCFEFYNCYAVASCPVYLQRIDLEAQPAATAKQWRFVQTQEGVPVDLERAKIRCEFLEFQGVEAEPKS